MKSKLKLVPHALTHSLMAEMREALEHMEAGDYDGAFEILEARCRPSDLATDLKPMFDADLELRRAMVEMGKHMPKGLLRAHHICALQNAAMAVAQALAPGDWIESGENALCAAHLVSDFGVSLEWNYEQSREEIEADLAALRGSRGRH